MRCYRAKKGRGGNAPSEKTAMRRRIYRRRRAVQAWHWLVRCLRWQPTALIWQRRHLTPALTGVNGGGRIQHLDPPYIICLLNFQTGTFDVIFSCLLYVPSRVLATNELIKRERQSELEHVWRYNIYRDGFLLCLAHVIAGAETALRQRFCALAETRQCAETRTTASIPLSYWLTSARSTQNCGLTGCRGSETTTAQIVFYVAHIKRVSFDTLIIFLARWRFLSPVCPAHIPAKGALGICPV